MDASTWERLRETLADALALERDERDAFLLRTLEDEPDLVAEAQRLLAHEEHAERLEPSAAGGRGAPVPVGRRLGPWRVEAALGSGGMGSVWRVVRDSDGQRAALKLLHLGLALSPAGLRRFQSERRLLARLEHPGIARLIDGGVTEDGLPFLVLEYVEGRALDRFAQEERLDVRARVRLFGHVCAAVAYAHQHLIVHRDLKPANIVVDTSGRARLLDFGIAKLLDGEEADEADDVTRAGERPMTPRYASPEQVRGEPLSTASDVYSLGVVLYEFLCGVSPYAGTRGAAQLERAVCDSHPGAPSTALGRASPERSRVDARRLRRQLAGDLDRIVLRAMAKEPERRYASAAELADDLERWLDGRPVRARPDSPLYRATRFAARNRLAVAAGLALAASLLLGSAATWREARVARAAEQREARARTQAELRFDQARALLDDLVFGVHDRIARLPGATPVRRFVLERTRAHLELLSADPDLRARLGAELAATWMRLAQVQGTRTVGSEGDVEGALESTQRARELLAAALERAPDEPERFNALCDAERQLGDLERMAGRHTSALAQYALVETLVERGLVFDAAHTGLRRQKGLAAAQRGRVLLDQSRTQDALSDLTLAHSLLSELAARAPARELERDLMLIETRLAGAEADAGEHARSLATRRSARDRARRLEAAEPLDAQLALDAAAADVLLAEGLRNLARYDEAATLLGAAVERLRRLEAADPTNQLPRQHRIEALQGLGMVARWSGDAARAVECYAEAAALAEARAASSRGDGLAEITAAHLAALWGDALWAVGEREQAVHCFERALERLGGVRDGVGDGAEARQAHFMAELGLADVAAELDGPHATRDMLEGLLERAGRDRADYPQAAWPLRNQALAGWRLATVLEAWARDAARDPDERIELLVRARTLYTEGRDVAEHMAVRGWLTPDERRRDVGALFAADVARADAALADLGVAPGS